MSLTGLTVNDYCDYIKTSLGGSVVNIEVEEDIPKIVNYAFTELKNYIMDPQTITLPWSTVMDLSPYKIANVISIERAKNLIGPGGLQGIMFVYSRLATGGTPSVTDIARYTLANQNKNAISTDADFYYDKVNQKLYTYFFAPYPETITLNYTPMLEDVTQIYEPYWQDLLRRLALAMTKEILGRVRGKYDLQSSTYKLDGERLLTEAQSELTEIRTFLRENSDLLLPLD